MPGAADKRTTDTKERILAAALQLFAEQGFASTSVSQIADAVGISAPALYKHFPSKQAVFDALLEAGAQSYDERMESLQVNFLADAAQRAAFVRVPLAEQVVRIQELFLHTLGDDMPSQFRKLMTIEEFNIPRLAAQFNQRYVEDQLVSFEALMREFIEAGIFREGDTRAMALQYSAPISLYIEVCDREPQRRGEALEAIARHLRQFYLANKVIK